MRKAELFDGFKIIQVSEGEEFRLEKQFPGEEGKELIFKVRADITVRANVVSKDGKGTTCVVTKIEAEDEIAEQVLDAVDVEFDETEIETPKKIVFSKKDTKKNIVEQIEDLGLEIDTKQTKAKILEELEGLDNIEVI